MKRFISLIMVLVLSFAMIACVAQAGAIAPNNTKENTGAKITGKVKVSFQFDNDGIAKLLQNGEVVKTVNIAADGTYEITDIPAGAYALLVSVPGWTDYYMYDITLADDDNVQILDEVIYAGDVNKDNAVTIADVSGILSNVNKAITDVTVNSDVNHDGSIDILDITQTLLADNYAHVSLPACFLNNGYSYNY